MLLHHIRFEQDVGDRMTRFLLRVVAGVALLLLAASAIAQQTRRIQTDTSTVDLRSDEAQPSLVAVSPTAGEPWKSDRSEPLIASIERSGRTVPVRWHFDAAGSETSTARVRFVYRSEEPKLR